MKLIVGLGNPGQRYDGTRHNIGFAIVDQLAGRWSVDTGREKFHAFYGEGLIAGVRAVILKPLTYMNLSGKAVQAAGRFFKLSLEDLLVICDDMDLPLGRIRLRPEGSAGGQKGLADIERQLGTSDYARLRFGIGRPEYDSVDWVLSPFAEFDRERVAQAQARTVDAVEKWVQEGIVAAMNAFNGTPNDGPETT